MYAVFQLSGYQYTGEEGALLRVSRQDIEQGESLDIDQVLLIKGDGDPIVGTPYVENARIEAEVVGHGKAEKIRVHKYKPRIKYRRTMGHRQDYSEIRINKIVSPDQ